MLRDWLGIVVLSASCLGQTPAPTHPPADKPSTPPAKEPSLDDLLGIPKPAPADTPPPAQPAPTVPDPKQGELERKLTDAEAQEAFVEAIRMMSETADRLEKVRDTGITTQRLQEQIIRKLDALIKKSNEDDSGGSSSSSSSQNQQTSQSQPNQPSQGQKQDSRGGQGEQAGVPPARRDAELNNRLDAARAAWGALPGRLRDLFTQGMDDYYSRLYQSMTEEYYRKTAESAPP